MLLYDVVRLDDGCAYTHCRIAVIPIIFGNAFQVLLQTLFCVDVLMTKVCKMSFRGDFFHLLLKQSRGDSLVARKVHLSYRHLWSIFDFKTSSYRCGWYLF